MSKPDEAMVVWLAAALDEIERVARRARMPRRQWRSGVWHVDPDGVTTGNHRVCDVYARGGPGETESPQEAVHIALNDPRAVLARVQAERAVVELHRSEWFEIPDIDGGVPYNAYLCTECCAGEEWPCDTLRWLAYGHRFDVPGWREEWDPEVIA